VGLAIVVVIVGLVKRIGTRYAITTQRLRIKRGIFRREVQQTRIERVQNVNTRQTFVDRILRVGTVDFDTAGTDDSDFTFFGVSHPEAIVTAVDRAQREAAALERFDPEAVAAFGEADVGRLLADAAIVRNRSKIEATIANARGVLALREAGTPLDARVWEHRPPERPAPQAWADVPSIVPESV